jgi:hypothetical protein
MPGINNRKNNNFLKDNFKPELSSIYFTFIVTCYITKVVSSNPTHDEVYSMQHYVIKCVSGL